MRGVAVDIYIYLDYQRHHTRPAGQVTHSPANSPQHTILSPLDLNRVDRLIIQIIGRVVWLNDMRRLIVMAEIA